MPPLADVRVLDFAALPPGPFATPILAEAGAEAIEIERPGGEDMRAGRPRAVEEELDGLAMNPAGFSRAGYALRDAVAGCAGLPYVEVHVSNIRYTRLARAELGAHVTAFDAAGLPEAWSSASAAGLALLDAEMLRQAGAIAYVNDFKLMTLVALAAMPLLLIVRLPRHR